MVAPFFPGLFAERNRHIWHRGHIPSNQPIYAAPRVISLQFKRPSACRSVPDLPDTSPTRRQKNSVVMERLPCSRTYLRSLKFSFRLNDSRIAKSMTECVTSG